MKKTGIIIALVAVALTSCGMLGKNAFMSATDYNNKITRVINGIDKDWDAVMNADESDKEGRLALSKTLADNAQKGAEELKKLGGYKKDDGFVTAAMAYAEFMSNLAKTELVEYVNLMSKGDEMTQEDVDRVDELLVPLNEKRDEMFNKALEEQNKFNAKNN